MPLKYRQLTLSEAQAQLSSQVPEFLQKTRDFVEGRHWKDGEYWIGPAVRDETQEGQDTMKALEEGFISANKCDEVVNRHVEALLAEPPLVAWSVPLEEGQEPSDEDRALIAEAETLQQEFWRHHNVEDLIYQAARTLLFAERAAIRLFVPKGNLRSYTAEGVEVDYDDPDVAYRVFPAEEMDKAIHRLSLHVPEPETAAVVDDEDSSAQLCLYSYQLTTPVDKSSPNLPEEVRLARLSRRATAMSSGAEGIEVSYLETIGLERPLTVIRSLTAVSPDNKEVAEVPVEPQEEAPRRAEGVPVGTFDSNGELIFEFDFSGMLPIYEVRRRRLITDQVIENQKLINLSMSMLPRNVVLAGFLERVITNAQPPGHYEKGNWVTQQGTEQLKWEASPTGRSQRFVAHPHAIGAGTLNMYQGLQYTDESGNTRISTPGVYYKDPITPKHIEDTARIAYWNILQETSQLHYAMASDATASGISRVNARTEFGASVKKTKPLVEQLLEYAAKAPLVMAAALSGNQGKFDKLEVTVTCRVNLGPITPEERNAIISQYTSGLMSRETAMELLGAVDLDAELDRLNQDPVYRMKLLQQQVNVGRALAEMGIEVKTIAELVGLDQETAVKLFGGTTEPPTQEQ